MKKQTNVGISIIIFNENHEVLLGKRKGSIGEGLWSTPGGKMEFMETAIQTCERELKEEIGTNFKHKIINYHQIGFSEDFFFEDDLHYITLYFAIKISNKYLKDIKTMEKDKCEGWQWFSIDNLPKVKEVFCDGFNQIIIAANKLNLF